MRKAIVGLRKQARGEELQRVAELEEGFEETGGGNAIVERSRARATTARRATAASRARRATAARRARACGDEKCGNERKIECDEGSRR